MFTADETIEMARKHLEEKYGNGYGSLKKAAEDLHINVDTLGDLRRGKGAPPLAVLRSMGFKRVMMYVKEDKP